MRRLAAAAAAAAAAVLVLCGCAGNGGAMEQALRIRSALLGQEQCSFRCRITADYEENLEEFVLECKEDGQDGMAFSVAEPESIRGIAGSVTEQEGKLTFEEEVLAFPMMAGERLSPLSAPWILLKALKSGCITAVVREDDLLHMSIDDSYSDDALQVEIWADPEGKPVLGEISWQGRRMVSMQIEDFLYG